VKIRVQIVGLTSLPPNQHVFLISNFLNLVILVGKKMKKIMQIQKNKGIARKLKLKIPSLNT
jgi:Zn-finger domain-containing protein